jgi:hypothetical protein
MELELLLLPFEPVGLSISRFGRAPVEVPSRSHDLCVLDLDYLRGCFLSSTVFIRRRDPAKSPPDPLGPPIGRSTGTGSCRDTIRARQPSRSAARGRTAWHRHRRAHSLSDSVTQNPHASGDHHRTPGRAHAPCLRARPREAVGVAGARCPPVRSAEEHRVGRARGPCLRAAPPLTVCSSPRCARMTARAPPPH